MELGTEYSDGHPFVGGGSCALIEAFFQVIYTRGKSEAKLC
jgi:hypothetical protein